MNVLFASSEVFPLIKTGGLADVAGSLPVALRGLGADVRIVLPAYGDVMAQLSSYDTVARLTTEYGPVNLLSSTLPNSDVPAWLVEHGQYFDRAGNPYHDESGEPWPDNAERFALFCAAIVAIAQGQTEWRPDVLHLNDWQTGLVPALLSSDPHRPATVFTIHNLAYQGMFPYASFVALGLPEDLWRFDALEFHGQWSFMKGGLTFSDKLTTVSPGYAREIQTAEFGHGLEGLLAYRKDDLLGILNGIDRNVWSPSRDAHLVKRYSRLNLKEKLANKLALQKEMMLPTDPFSFVIGMVGRLATQKGVDLMLSQAAQLARRPLQFVILGSGDSVLETQLKTVARKYSHVFSVKLGYDEALAHRIEAGADAFLMPSRFEPCGLNQLYSLRYGTVPIVRAVGGLADTVVDANQQNIKSGKATGITFTEASGEALLQAVDRAIALYQDPVIWKQLILTGMHQDYSWERSAKEYHQLYASLVGEVKDQRQQSQ